MTSNEKQFVSPISPAEVEAYYPDDKIVMVSHGPPPSFVTPSTAPSDTSSSMLPSTQGTHLSQKYYNETRSFEPPTYSQAPLPERPNQRPFYKRHMLWLIGILLLIIITAGIVIGVLVGRWSGKKSGSGSANAEIFNNTKRSVASSGLFLNDKTWNMQTYWQDPNGDIRYQMSLDGKKFETPRNTSLMIRPKVGSPLSATAETDPTGVVYLSVFYLSESNKITMCVMACGAGASVCSTFTNTILPTGTPVAKYSGLAAVTVSKAQDWRVYYHDENNFICQMEGKASGFTKGEIIGTQALNNSALGAVNVNTTTNNIVLYYIDQKSQILHTQQFTDGKWTVGSPLSTARVKSWNPLSGIGATYSSGHNQLHVYYTGLDSLIYEFTGSNASSTKTNYSTQPSPQREWSASDIVGGAVTAVGWDSNVRIFHQSQGVLIEGAQTNGTFSQLTVNLT
ncbi:hypothetical protein HYALB_00012267 [Hymenoscyphus albidus]|uniref:Fucose-specific lectin n=1 Tax=Hymenoscyphus albidus TaxID=595503 RepID=A0A9N9LTW0_9HELO|nr:hypothetical protein HYALB_00012267 [Hymenoscyphus albidus]